MASARRRLVDRARVGRSYWRCKGAADRPDSKIQRARPHGSVEGDFSRAFLLNRSYDRPPAAPRQMWTPGIYMDIHRLHQGSYNNLVAVCLATEVSFIVISVVPKTRSEKGTPSRGVSLQASLLLFSSC